MPQPGQKSVTLPSELVEAAQQAAQKLAVTGSAYIAAAVREKLATAHGAAPAPSPAPVTITEPRRQRESEGTAADRSTEAGTAPRLPDGSTGPSSAAKPVVAAPRVVWERPREAPGASQLAAEHTRRKLLDIPSPPSASEHPIDVAPGPGEERTAVPVRISRPAAGRSPRPEPAKVGVEPEVPGSPAIAERPTIPPGEDRPPAPKEKGAARDVPPPEISTWTCPKCAVTMPLVERWFHKCRGRETEARTEGTDGPAESGKNRPREAPVPGPLRDPAASSNKQVDVDKLTRFVKMFLSNAKAAPDRRAYLAAAVQAGHRDQGLEIPDEEAVDVLNALIAREPAIERALEPFMSLDPNVSRSTTSSAKKGEDRGR